MPERVHIDEQIFIFQSIGGISRYFQETVTAMSNLQDGPAVVSQAFHFVQSQLPNWNGNVRVLPPGRWSARACYVGNWPSRFAVPRRSLVHATFYHPRMLRYWRSKETKLVSTVHDMIPEQFPQMFRENPHLAKREFLKHSSAITCVSETTKQSLLNIWPDLKAPIVVAKPGVSSFWSEVSTNEDAAVSHNWSDFVVYVGGRHDYKGFHFLLEALSRPEAREVRLLSVGGGKWNSRESAMITELGLWPRVVQRSLDDIQLRDAYRHAAAVVSPSLAEGFGLPVLEAAASGGALLLSDIPVYREVASDFAEFFEPGDPDALANALAGLADPTSSLLPRHGGVPGTKFTWENTASQTTYAYDLALGA